MAVTVVIHIFVHSELTAYQYVTAVVVIFLNLALVEVREAYKDDMPKLKATVDHFKEKMSILYDKRQSEVQPKKDSQNIER